MSPGDERSRVEQEELVSEGLDALDQDAGSEERERLEALAERVEEPGLQDRILDRYLSHGRQLLSDDMPERLDPRMVSRLEPMLGDVSDVRVHKGKVASEAARAMDARAFAIGDQDIFVDDAHYQPGSRKGGALLAHEVAHTRDAATGFAMSKVHGSSTSAREAFAEAIEMEYAEEDDLKPAPDIGDADREPYSSTAADRPPEPKVDKIALTQRVYEILKERETRAADRTGR